MYKADCAAETLKMAVESQTERCGVFDSLEQSMQTDTAAVETAGVQTDHTQFYSVKEVQASYQVATVDSQTDGAVPVSERSVQVGATQANVLVQTSSSMARQLDGQVQATVTVAQVDCQTVVLSEDRGLQTEVNTRTVVSQTVRAEKHETSQTERNSAGKVTQTTVSMALQKEQHVQAVVTCADTNAQTTMSMALQTDHDVQAVADTVSGDSQTSVSMALESDKDVQAVATSADGDSQTQLDQIHRPCQTAISIGHEEHKDVQASVDTGEGESQTENMMVDGSSQATVESKDSNPKTEAVENTETDTAAATAESGVTNVKTPSASQESQHDDSEPFAIPDIPYDNEEPAKDEESQTDPVTIIIGDASVLLERLRGSTTNKVTTNENEIEIEVHDVGSLQHGGSPAKKKTTRRNTVSKYMRQSTTPRTPVTPQEAAVPSRQMMPVILRDEVPFVMPPVAMFGSSSERGKYSCPFCTMTFHESPTLYEHLQNSHIEKCKSVKKPKGREGKTIVFRQPMPAIVYTEQMMQHEELDPPVLVPVIPLTDNQTPEDDAGEAYKLEPQPLVAYPTAIVDTTAVVDSPRNNLTHVHAHHEPELVQHEVQKFACSECGKIFDEATQLQSHLKVVHNINSIIEEVEIPGIDDAIPETVSLPAKRKQSPVMSPMKRRRPDDLEPDTRVTRNTRSSIGKDANNGTPLKGVASPLKQERQLRGVVAKK